MRAAVAAGARRLRLDEVDTPVPNEGEVAIAVAACGICGSNLHEWRHPERSIAPGGIVVPGVAGHEVVGRVVEVGASVDLAVDTRVAVEPNLAQACGTCEVCRTGNAWFCSGRTALPVWGFADRIVVRAGALFPVPDDVDDDVATLVEPLACAVHGLRGTERALSGHGGLGGATVAVVGAGVAGLLTLRAAGHLGAGRLVSVARYAHQAAAARRLGSDVVLDGRSERLLEDLRAERPDVVVEAVGGSGNTFDLAVRSVAPGGEVVVLGLFDGPRSLDPRRAVFRELRLSFPVTYGSRNGIHDFDHALRALVDGGEAVASLVSHRFALDDVEAAFARADDKGDDVLRVVVTP